MTGGHVAERQEASGADASDRQAGEAVPKRRGMAFPYWLLTTGYWLLTATLRQA